MFQFRRFPTQCYFIHKELTEYCSAGFPHSEIHGSLPAFDFPWLIVDRYVLHRLPMPRHPPCALFSLTFSELCVLMFVNFSTRLYCSIFTHLTIVKSFEYLLHYLVVSISHYLYSVFKVHLQAFRLVWWAQEDSNLRPHAYQACALTTWATSPFDFRRPVVVFRLPTPCGGDEEDRTPDPLLAKQVLSQLSYTPISLGWKPFS